MDLWAGLNVSHGLTSSFIISHIFRQLNKAEEEAQTEIEIDEDNKSEATTTLKTISRIRLAVIDLDKK